MTIDIRTVGAHLTNSNEKEKKTERYALLLTPSNYEKLFRLAKYYKCTPNAFINELLTQIEIPEEANNPSTDK